MSWLLLLAIGQAGFLMVALLSAPQRELRPANRLLAALLLVCAAVILHAWLGVNRLYTVYPHSANAIATLGLATGPLLYFYLRSVLYDTPLRVRAWLHFLPFALATLAMLPFYLQSGEAKLAWMLQRAAPPWYLAPAALVKLALFLTYAAAGARLVRQASDSALAAGLGRLMKVWLVGGIISVAALAIELAELPLPVSADVVGALALLMFVYATALLAIRLPLSYRPMPEPPPPSKVKYANRSWSEADRAAFMARLQAAMEGEQLYRNGELKLDELAGAIAMTPHELSQLINEVGGVNFQEFVNRYRVEALKTALHAPSEAAHSILDLGIACGFNSKSALNRIFKSATGMTPSEYRKQAPAA
ncbi:helix-turn-helix transcriptional regulator [Massilia sp. CF038]|uniref:helix-turn-helix transcriptional regulator n=1 Tax=Massilia sp. CF038 TaxID=1881045 RepID=UPI00091D6410|nr:helix-turn-helix transcriptional regulator [Massilia sp. CF038]SHG35680.1 transcriptional regulator, AraC family [Massilia sp. CF038]